MPYGKKKSMIDLTTIISLSQIRDNHISLDQCALPDILQQPGFKAGYYGFQAQNGLSFSTYVADLHGEKIRSVIFQVKLDHPVSHLVKPENLSDIDFIHFSRLSEAMVAKISDFWHAEMKAAGWSEKELDEINWRYIEKFVPLYEQPVSKLLDLPEFRHIKVFVYPGRAQTIKTNQAWFAIGLTRPEHIKSAFVRFEPDIKVEI